MSDAPSGEPPPESAPRKFHFKSREFDVANAPVATPSPHGPTDVHEHLRAAAGGTPDSAAPRPAERENEVHEILRANIARASAAGLNDVKPVIKRPSRRRRDYWITLVAVNCSIASLVLVLGPNVVSVLFGFGGMVFISTALTWIMFFVVDDY